MYPKIYLSIDNCFASKRWTEPGEWMRVVRELGLRYVEASADTECDPLYTTPGYMTRWTEKVRRASEETGVTLSQMYSGHGTYATLGLCHPDGEIRRHMLEDWLFPMCRTAGSLGANIGFYCHALSQATLQEPARYRDSMELLYGQLARVAECAADAGCPTAGVELMYSPHQPPWTLAGATELLREVNRLSSRPFYTTIDVGHQVGQRRFLRPDRARILESLGQARENLLSPPLWLGPDRAYALFRRAAACRERGNDLVEQMIACIDEYPYLFSSEGDGDTGLWLSALGSYSPIVHLQQTDGFSSRHLPFTAECNRTGVVRAEEVLRALRAAYERGEEAGMPPRVDRIYLTLEIFSGTADHTADLLDRLRESVAYWRQFVPEDGLSLDQLNIGGENV